MLVNAVILSKLKLGDTAAFTVIFEAYWQKLFRAAYNRVKDEQLAQDMVQDVFTQVWDRRETLNLDPASIEFYLLRSVRNRVINHYTSKQVKEALLQRIMERMEQMSHNSDDIKRYIELEEFVNIHIESFPETMRAVFLMRSDKFTIQQIAAALNIAEQTVKNNISEAIRRLRNALSKKFSDEEILITFLMAAFLIKN